jgi:copper chaperone
MTTTTIGITGMTCGHCVSAVKSELSGLSGVETVDVDLVNGGTSTATISSSAPLEAASVKDAVAEAGYTVVPAGA